MQEVTPKHTTMFGRIASAFAEPTPGGHLRVGGAAGMGVQEGHWVTIKGNHVLIHDLTGEPVDEQLPPPPRSPGVDQSAWEKSVDQSQISPWLGTVHDLGLILFNETQSFTNRPDSNEPIDVAREKLAHVIINGDTEWGPEREKWSSTGITNRAVREDTCQSSRPGRV